MVESTGTGTRKAEEASKSKEGAAEENAKAACSVECDLRGRTFGAGGSTGSTITWDLCGKVSVARKNVRAPPPDECGLRCVDAACRD